MKSFQNIFWATPFLSIFVAVSTWAAPPIYGWEFEFTNKEMAKIMSSNGAPTVQWENLRDFVNYYKGICPECIIRKSPKHNTDNSYRIEFPDGFDMTVATKPGVFEFTGPPMTLKELQEKYPILEKRIFEPMKSFGAYTTANTAGHLSIGYLKGLESPEMIMKFLVDAQNYHLLWSDILNNDPYNAPTLSQLKESQREAFRTLIKKFRTSPRLQNSPRWLAKYIQDEVYFNTTAWNEDAYHYQAINVETLDPDEEERPKAWRIELRGIRSQDHAREFLLYAEVFEKRLELLRNSQTPLVYAPHEIPKGVSKSQFAVDSFYTYIKELGLDWERYRPLMRKRFQNYKPRLRPELMHQNSPARVPCFPLFAS